MQMATTKTWSIYFPCTITIYSFFCVCVFQFNDNVYQARRNAHKAIEMCVHTSPGTDGVVDAKLVPVLVGKLLGEEEEIKVCCAFSKVTSARRAED